MRRHRARQDIWEWLLRTANVSLAQEIPWPGAVAQNYIRRFWRRSFRRSIRERTALGSAGQARFDEPAKSLESKEVLDRVFAALPDRERKLLTLIRNGYSLAEAARALKIPRGSRSYYGGRLIDTRGGSSSATDPPEERAPPRADRGSHCRSALRQDDPEILFGVDLQ